MPVGPADVRYEEIDENADLASGDNDGQLDFNSFPCFGPGTKIMTPTGLVKVEDLEPGMSVTIAGGASLPVLWVGRRELELQDGDAANRPVLCRKGSLGLCLPEHDLVLSPQHRLCFDGPVVEEVFSAPRVLAPVKGMLGLPGVRWMNGKRRITYVSILLEKHAIMFAEGTPVESLYPGGEALKALGPQLCRELFTLIPNLEQDGVDAYGAPAMPLLTVGQAKTLTAGILASQTVAGQANCHQSGMFTALRS
ncbi:Hint domain-containing protein [Loktanella sp. S4079]|uniref:Hint domain-containing protein n=1 Tax=Loktanella sp. S4079 TaxID=579483 RepID=UPI000698E33E|nr:Hint domain-containing protein [Loktanella sp. S4079]